MSVFVNDRQPHWLQGARHVASPNCNERPDPDDISLIVVHGISLPPGQFGAGYIEPFFLNQLCSDDHPYFKTIEGLTVSSHLLIERSGEIVQFVGFDQRAWHAGNSEFAGRGDCNDFSIGIELEGTDTEPYTDAQYQQLIQVIHALHAAYPKTQSNPVVGHCHIAPGRKTDPGDAFEWQKLSQAGVSVWTE